MGAGVRNLMRVWIVFAGLVMVAGLGFILARLHPPAEFVLAAGPADGAYAQIAGQYRYILAEDNINLIVRETAGSQENAELLEKGAVDAAILQGGIHVDGNDVEAIGTVFFEPMFFLARSEMSLPTNPALWSGLRITAGLSGSGTAAVFRDFVRAAGLNTDANTFQSLSYSDAITALDQDTVDVAVFIAPMDAPYLVKAYRDPEIQFLALDYGEAISRRLAYADTVTVPAGAMSLNPVMPPRPHTLIALETRLAVQDSLHPALVNRLTMAAIRLHSDRGIINDPNSFPSVDGTMLPVNNAARQLITEGPSTWYDWLPYWMAAQINRLFLLLLPFVFVVLPLLRLLPQAYAYVMRWRVWQYYPDIRQIEEGLDQQPDAAALRDMTVRLRSLDDRLAHLRLPAAYRQGQYDARLHIELVQKRITELQGSVALVQSSNVVPINP